MKRYAVTLIVAAAGIVGAVLTADRKSTAPRTPAIAGMQSAPVAAFSGSTVSVSALKAPETSDTLDDDGASDRAVTLSSETESEESQPESRAARSERQDAQSDTENAHSENWDDPCECATALRERWEEHVEAARRAEPKDVSWAYETEQLLAQYIAAAPEMKGIAITSVECKTTFCEIKAIGTQDRQESFYGVMHEVREQAWSTFGEGGVGRSRQRDDGRKDFDEVIARAGAPPTSAGRTESPAWNAPDRAGRCECATDEWQERKRAHDEAKRAAEPKDVQWAYRMEQAFNAGLAAHAQVFADYSVDCRTTYCEIRATGLTPESQGIFEQVEGEVLDQTREFTGGEGGFGEDGDGRYSMKVRLNRR